MPGACMTNTNWGGGKNGRELCSLHMEAHDLRTCFVWSSLPRNNHTSVLCSLTAWASFAKRGSSETYLFCLCELLTLLPDCLADVVREPLEGWRVRQC